MQLKVGRNVAGFAAYAGQATGITPNERNPVTERLAAAGRLIQGFFAQLTGDRPTPLQTTFLILENQDLQGMAQCDVALGQSLCHLDRTQGANDAVVVAALRHRIDMRSDNQHRQSRIAAHPPPRYIAGRIDIHDKSRGPHQSHHIFSALAVGIRVGHTAVTSRWIFPNRAHGVQTLDHAVSIDVWRRLRTECWRGNDHRHKKQEK